MWSNSVLTMLVSLDCVLETTAALAVPPDSEQVRRSVAFETEAVSGMAEVSKCIHERRGLWYGGSAIHQLQVTKEPVPMRVKFVAALFADQLASLGYPLSETVDVVTSGLAI
jgi:hypothetical protein